MVRLIIFFFLLLLNCSLFGQVPVTNDLGQGSIRIKLFWFAPSDTCKMDTSKHTLLDFNYSILHDKIFRQGELTKASITRTANGSVPSSSKQLQDGSKITIGFSSHIVMPTYLIDWNKKVVYEFFKKDGGICISQDSLLSNTHDIFFKASLTVDAKSEVEIDTVNQEKVTVAGLPGYRARFKAAYNNSWRSFTYSVEKLALFPPLNYLLGYKFPFPVTSVDVENREFKGNKYVTSMYRMQIISYSSSVSENSLFEVPPNIKILKNAPYAEMYKPVLKQ